MDVIISAIILVFVIIWAFRVENGINKANQSLKRLEEQLISKKEKK